MIPSSTYRLQLRNGIGLREAAAMVPYLDELGVGALYLSPVFQARQGSTHGYDAIDPTVADPALGSMVEFVDLARALRQRGMGLLLDLVPNHMAASLENPWWADVLENGTASPHALWFAIDWTAGRLVLPVLPKPLSRCAVRIHLTAAGFRADVAGQAWPLSTASCRGLVFQAARKATGPAQEALREALRPDLATDPLATKALVWWAWHNGAQSALEAAMRGAKVRAILGTQAYRLEPWRAGLAHLRHRRFFDIADLVGLRMDRPEVFAAVHGLPQAWANTGFVTGLRIDHVDGLRDPKAYLDRLHKSLPAGTHVLVEKILSPGETIPRDWKTHGTTGYEAATALTGLFVPPRGLAALAEAYRERTGQPEFAQAVTTAKREAVASLFQSEFRALAQSLRALGVPRLSEPDAQRAIAAATVHLGVYRTYARGRAMPAPGRKAVLEALRASKGEASPTALRRLEEVLLRPATEGARAWRLRWQQATGAVMAKGLEDCALYRWAPLAALSEVGGRPDQAADASAWHAANQERLRSWPGAMTAATTHDTKRSQDLRLRQAVLAADPARWLRLHEAWLAAIPGWPHRVGRRQVPDAHEAWTALQAVAGLWPLRGRPDAQLVQRLQECAVKSAREEHRHTSWLRPDARHEGALRAFVAAAVAAPKPRGWAPFVRDMQRCGALASLSALALQAGAPGVPDVYQDSEDWSLLLVDPDNRRPVQPERLARHLASAQDATAEELAASWPDGRVKAHVLSRLLRLRRGMPALFLEGGYEPLQAEGPRAGHVVAFMRRRGAQCIAVVATRWHLGLPLRRDGTVDPAAWQGTHVALDPGRWQDALSDRTVAVRGGRLELSDCLRGLPCALLVARP